MCVVCSTSASAASLDETSAPLSLKTVCLAHSWTNRLNGGPLIRSERHIFYPKRAETFGPHGTRVIVISLHQLKQMFGVSSQLFLSCTLLKAAHLKTVFFKICCSFFSFCSRFGVHATASCFSVFQAHFCAILAVCALKRSAQSRDACEDFRFL